MTVVVLEPDTTSVPALDGAEHHYLMGWPLPYHPNRFCYTWLLERQSQSEKAYPLDEPLEPCWAEGSNPPALDGLGFGGALLAPPFACEADPVSEFVVMETVVSDRWRNLEHLGRCEDGTT